MRPSCESILMSREVQRAVENYNIDLTMINPQHKKPANFASLNNPANN